MSKKVYNSSARALRAADPEAFKQQANNTLVNKPMYADLYESLDDTGKQELNGYFNEKFLIENMMAQEEEALKYNPKNAVEQEIENTQKETGIDYKNYKDNKAEFNKLEEKTYGWKQKFLFEDMQKANNFKVKEGDNWFTRAGKGLANTVDTAINAGVSFVGAGIWEATEDGFTPQEQMRHAQLKKQLFEIEKPVLEKQRAEIQAKRDAVYQKYNIDPNKWFYNDLSSEQADKLDIANTYDKALKEYDSAIEEEGIWGGLVQDKVGILSLPENYRRASLVNKLKKEGEGSLTDIEKDLLEAYEISDRAMYSGLNSNSNYELGKSLRGSLEFMAEAYAGQRLIGGFAGSLSNRTLTGVGKTALDATKTIGSTGLMASTYNQAMQKFSESTQLIEDADGNMHYLASDNQKITEVNKIKTDIKILDSEINNLESKENITSQEEARLNSLLSKRDYLNSNLTELVDENGNLVKEETSLLDAGIYGVTQNIKENLAERYVGGIWDKYVPAIGNKLATSSFGKTVANSRIVRLADKLDTKVGNALKNVDNVLFESNKFGKLSKSMYAHVGPAKMIHSLPAEMVEEIAVQLAPTYGEDYATQLNELTQPDFYAQVASATLLMGGGFTAFGAGIHYKNMAMDADYRKAYRSQQNKIKDLKQQYQAIDNVLNDDDLAQTIAMKTVGTIFQLNDYKAKIAELRDPKGPNPDGLTQEKRNEQADSLERTAFMNMALQAVQTGTDKQLKKSLSKFSRLENVSENEKANAVKAIKKLEDFKAIAVKNRDIFNRNAVTDLEIRKDFLNETMTELISERNNLRLEFDNLVNEFDNNREGQESYGSMLFENSIENALDNNNPEFNNYVAEFIDANINNKTANRFLELTRNIGQLRFANQELTKQLDYETNPVNREEIAKRELGILREKMVSGVNKDNIESVKDTLSTKGLADAKTVSDINAKVIEETATAPEVNNKPARETIIHDNLLDDDLAQQFGKTADESDGPIKEKAKYNENQAVSANDLFDDFEAPTANLNSNEQATVDNINSGLYAPINYNPQDNVHTETVGKFKSAVSNFLKKQPTVTFGGLITSLYGDKNFGKERTDRYFDMLKQAWNEVSNDKVSNQDAVNLYNEFFASAENISEFAKTAFGGVIPQADVVLTDDIKQSDKAGESNLTEYNPETNREEKIEYAPHTEKKYAGIGLKLGGVLGLNYEESQEGKVTVTNEVNETAKPFMDWRNFKPGDVVDFVFDIDYMLNPENLMPIWDNLNAEYKNRGDEKPTKRLVSVRQRLVDLFRDSSELNSWAKIEQALQDYKNNPSSNNPLMQNEEFVKIAPIGTVNKNYVTDVKEDGTPADAVLMGGLNDYYWFNNANLALKVNKRTGEPILAEREIRLQENRKLNLEARKAIVSNGKLNVTVSENRDIQNNVRILKTEEEQKQGFTNEFHSLFSQFANNTIEFNKFATIAYLDASDNFVGSVNNSGDTVFAKINGKTVKKENIINFKSFLDNAKAKSFTNGRTVFIHQSGTDSNGQPNYLVHDVINNHKTKQEIFKKTREILDQLYFKLAIQKNDSNKQREDKEVLQKEFKRQFGYSFTTGVKQDLEGVYPKPHLENGKRSGAYRQDFDAKAQTPGLYDIIPDLGRFDSAEQFLEALARGQEIPGINKQEYLLNNLHTNLVFTPIEKNGETIYSLHSQPFMMFDFGDTVVTPNQEVINEENVQRLDIKRASLENQIKTVSNEVEKAQLETELKIVKKELVKERVQQAVQQVIQPTTETVTSLEGVEYQVSSNEIITQDTEAGPIRYIWNADRNLVMLREDVDTDVEFSDDSKYDIIDEIIGRTFSKINVSEVLSVEALYKLVDTEYNSLVNELKNTGKKAEANYMIENRDEILGVSVYEDSIREYINSMLDITDIEEFLDLTGENVKDVGQSSYEVDITKSLSFKVKLLLSGIKDSRLGTGFAGFESNMTLADSLDALHQILSEVNNNSIEDVKRVIEEKIKKNPTELSFYNQILNRLNVIEKTNPEIINEVMYNLYQPKVQMRFLMWRANRNGFMTLENYDANVKNPLFIKRSNWTESLKRNGLVDLYEGNYYRINENSYKAVEDIYNRIFEGYNDNKDINTVNRNDLKQFLKFFGIVLNEKTIDNIYNQQSQNDLDVGAKLFNGKNSILNVLYENLKTANAVEDKRLTFDNPTDNKSEARKLNLLTYRNSQINDLIHADNFVEFLPMNTMYIAGKSINMYQQPNPISNKIKNINQSLKDYIDNLENEDIPESNKLTGALANYKNTAITSNSLLLGLAERNPQKMVKYLDTFLISLESLKESGTKSREDMGITNLSDKDSLVTLLGMFASSEGDFTDREIDALYDKKIKLRKGIINFPTISDSSQLPFLKTILLELTNENVDLENSLLDESVLAVLREQLLVSDLTRIADYISKVGNTGSNVDGYDAGAIWITGLPSLNTVQVPYSYEANGSLVNTKRPLIYMFREFIASDPENNTPDAIANFVNQYVEEINEDINNNINFEADKLVTSDLQSGQFVEFELLDKDKLKLSDGKENGYFNGKTARMVAYDYVVNNFLQQKEIQTIFAGDIAQYFKNKMETGLKHGLPQVKFQDVVNYHYGTPEQLISINSITKGKEVENLTLEEKQQLISEYPELAFTNELITSGINHEEAYTRLLPVASSKVKGMFKDVQNNLSKRLKGQISPGSQLTNSKNLPNYIQVMVSDVENSSETIEDMVQRIYPEMYESLLPKLREFKAVDDIYNRNVEQEKRYKNLKKELDKALPKISAYLKTASTDAQEYTSWKENLNQLRSQGRITPTEFAVLETKLLAQTEDLKQGNNIKEENKLTDKEMKMAIMQPSKPLYSGMVHQDVNNTGHTMQRYVYVKSSSFPLLPELTQMFPKLNSLRKTIDRLEDKEGTTVRVSYQSANKVGAIKNAINVSELYDENVDLDKVLNSSLRLSRDNFYIQQDKPFKADKNAKNGKPDRVTRATQFEKIILGDGINKLGFEFPSNLFDSQLLSELNIEIRDEKIDGPSLKKIYNNLYEREQKILSDKLFDKLGINTYAEMKEGKPEVMEKLVEVLNRRLSNKQDKKALDLLYKVKVNGTVKTLSKKELIESGQTAYKAVFKMPLFMTPNSRKFESVLNSVVNKNNINLEMPGFSFPVASQEGFDYKGYTQESYDDLRSKGLVVSPDFDPAVGLKSTRDALTGKLKYAQVFLANKYKIYNTETGMYDYLNLKDYVNENNVIDLEKLPKDLLSMFSFRIPTSSHQSGTVIEVAGFLPHNMGDLMIVPKDHTVQIGEDYDIDVRYAYQYNYIKDVNGNIKKLEYSDIAVPEKTVKELREEYQKERDILWNNYFEVKSNVDTNAPLDANNFRTTLKNPYLQSNKEKVMEIIFLQDALDNYEVDKLMHAIFKDQYEIDNITREFLQERIELLENSILPKDVVADRKKELQAEYRGLKQAMTDAFHNEKSDLYKSWSAYRNAIGQKANELRVVENNLVAMYKTVFSSTNPEVQNLITKVLSTDFSEQSASEIDSRLSAQEPYFNIYSPSVQRKVMKLGADGKMGIGVHSNAVTMNSLLQQLDTPLQFINYWSDDLEMNIPYNIQLGNNTFNGILGKLNDGKRRLSEYLMESQNSATDNQKLEIMGRRNENAETIGIFSLLQMTAMEDDGISVNGNDLSYASLFISQPILLEYVDTIKRYKSSTNKSYGNPETLTEEDLVKKYLDLIPSKYWQKDKEGKILKGVWDTQQKEQVAKRLTSSYLFEQLRPLGDMEGVDVAAQYYILENFNKMKKPAKQLVELQQFVNIENGGLGVSYFDVINLKNKIGAINALDITTVDRINKPMVNNDGKSLFSEMFGDLVYETEPENFSELEEQGYIYVSETDAYRMYVKPTNHYSHKIINSISLGYNLWNTLFPYDHKYIQQQIDTIVDASGLNPNSKRALELKYDIISNMKDYSYTNSKVLFGNNVDKFQRELFFDDKDKGQESLGSYLMRLKNDDSFKYLFNLPFFKDLQIEINEKTYPTIIKYNTGDISPINNLKMYNRLLKLVNSNKLLPAKLNGKQMTESELMKELLMYSLLADQGNGAIGFRQLLPMELFEKYNVDSMLRNRNEIDSKEMTNFVYNGPSKSAEAFLNNSISERGVIENVRNIPVEEVRNFAVQLNSFSKVETGEDNVFLVNANGDILNTRYDGVLSQSIFVKQYFQHNPDKIAYPISYSDNESSKFQKLLKDNGISTKDFEDGKMTSFSMSDYDKPFIVVKDKDGSSQLFEKYDNIQVSSATVSEVSFYRRIPKLGVFGFNEYQTNRNINVSKIGNNNFNRDWINGEINVQRMVEYLNTADLNQIVEDMMNDYNGPYTALLSTLKEFAPDLSNVQVRTVTDLPGRAKYENEGGQLYITLSEKFINNRQTGVKELQDTLVEELLHHITTSTIEDYVTFTGITKNGVEYTTKEGMVVPAPLQTLISVYNSAIKHYSNKYGFDVLRNKMLEHINTIGSGENSSIYTNTNLDEDAYRTFNIHEFIAGIFIKDTNFATEMANTPYLQSGKSILAKFSDALAKFFNRILPGAKKDSITANLASNLLEFLEVHHNTPNNKLVNIEKQILANNSSVVNAQELLDDVQDEINEGVGIDDLFSPNSVSLSNPITSVKLKC